MKVFKFFSCIFALSCIFWLSEVCINLLDQQCQIERSLVERIILNVKEVFGIESPRDPEWWQSLCKLTDPQLKESIIILCNGVIATVFLLILLGIRYKKNRRINNQMDVVEHPVCECKIKLGKRCSKESDSSPANKKRKLNSRPVIRQKRKPRVQRKVWDDGYEHMFMPHIPTTEETSYRAVLLGSVNDCFQYLTSLLTTTFGKFGVIATNIKWSCNTDPMGTMTYLTGESDRMRVEVELVPGDGININCHRVDKVQGLWIVDTRSYQLTYMGLTCVGQWSTPLSGPGWDL